VRDIEVDQLDMTKQLSNLAKLEEADLNGVEKQKKKSQFNMTEEIILIHTRMYGIGSQQLSNLAKLE
jgi:hypothetical protein